MSEKNLNLWDKQYLIRAYDYVQRKWRDFPLMELGEEDWRKWVCWKLEQIQSGKPIKETPSKCLGCSADSCGDCPENHKASEGDGVK